MKSLKILLLLVSTLIFSVDVYSKSLNSEFVNQAKYLCAQSSTGDHRDPFFFNREYNEFSGFLHRNTDSGAILFNGDDQNMEVVEAYDVVKGKTVNISVSEDNVTKKITLFCDGSSNIGLHYVEASATAVINDEKYSIKAKQIKFTVETNSWVFGSSSEERSTSNSKKCLDYICQYFWEIKNCYTYQLIDKYGKTKYYHPQILDKCTYAVLHFSKKDTENFDNIEINTDKIFGGLIFVDLYPVKGDNDLSIHWVEDKYHTQVRRSDNTICLYNSSDNTSFEISGIIEESSKKRYKISAFDGSQKYDLTVTDVEYLDSKYSFEQKIYLEENMYYDHFSLLDFLDTILKKNGYQINYN